MARPKLWLAGAGSGKTNTLAYWVAHLIVQGADPRRILLMTFSRRPASEMTKRVERIDARVSHRSAPRHVLQTQDTQAGRWRSHAGTGAIDGPILAAAPREHNF